MAEKIMCERDENQRMGGGNLCCHNGKTQTGYPKVGESRVFLPLNQWQLNWARNLAMYARSEALVYGGRLKTSPIKEINLLEVGAMNPRDEVQFTSNTASTKYIFRIMAFRIRGKMLTAQWQIDQAWAVHSNVYLFPGSIKLEYDSMVVGEFIQEIRNGEKLVNYLHHLTDRRFTFTFGLSDLILEEFSLFKSLWSCGHKGFWIDQQSIPLVNQLHLQNQSAANDTVETADQIKKLEKTVMENTERPLKTSELDKGKTVQDLKEANKKNKEERAKDPKMFTSTRLGATGLEASNMGVEEEEESEDAGPPKIAQLMLKEINSTGKAYVPPPDEEIMGLVKLITDVSKKMEKQEQSGTRSMDGCLLVVDALREALNKPKLWAEPSEMDGSDKAELSQMAGIMKNIMEGRTEKMKKSCEEEDPDPRNSDWLDFSSRPDENFNPDVKDPKFDWGGSGAW